MGVVKRGECVKCLRTRPLVNYPVYLDLDVVLFHNMCQNCWDKLTNNVPSESINGLLAAAIATPTPMSSGDLANRIAYLKAIKAAGLTPEPAIPADFIELKFAIDAPVARRERAIAGTGPAKREIDLGD